MQYRSRLPPASELVGDLEEDAPWVHAALDHLALECQEELDDLLLPGSFVPSSPSSLSDVTVSSSHLAESMEDDDFVSVSVAHFQNAGYAFVARTGSIDSASLLPAAVGNAHMPRTRPRRSRRWPARQLARPHLKDQYASDRTPVRLRLLEQCASDQFGCSSGYIHACARMVYRDDSTCVSLCRHLDGSRHSRSAAATRVLSLLVIVVVPAVGIFTAIDQCCPVRVTRPDALQDADTHVLAWCLVMFPLVCHSVAIWMEVVHPGVLLLLRLLSLMVIVMVPAVGIFTLCEDDVLRHLVVSSSATSRCTRPLRTSRCHVHSMSGCGAYPATPAHTPAGSSGTLTMSRHRHLGRLALKRVLVLFAGPKRKDDIGSCLTIRGCPSDRVRSCARR